MTIEQLTDLEITERCAKAMGLKPRMAFGMPHVDCAWSIRDTSDDKGALKLYWPLTDDAQAMALVKKFKLTCVFDERAHVQTWECRDCLDEFGIKNPDLNHAICECVARME